jgi:hypothetical protein
MSLPKLAFEVWPEFPFILERLAIRDFSRLSCERVTCTPVQSAMNMADFRVCEHRRHSRGLGWRAGVSNPLLQRSSALVRPIEGVLGGQARRL